MIWRRLGLPPLSPQGTPQGSLLWWEFRLSVEGLNHEAFHASEGEQGQEGFEDGQEIALEDLGIQVRQVG